MAELPTQEAKMFIQVYRLNKVGSKEKATKQVLDDFPDAEYLHYWEQGIHGKVTASSLPLRTDREGKCWIEEINN